MRGRSHAKTPARQSERLRGSSRGIELRSGIARSRVPASSMTPPRPPTLRSRPGSDGRGTGGGRGIMVRGGADRSAHGSDTAATRGRRRWSMKSRLPLGIGAVLTCAGHDRRAGGESPRRWRDGRSGAARPWAPRAFPPGVGRNPNDPAGADRKAIPPRSGRQASRSWSGTTGISGWRARGDCGTRSPRRAAETRSCGRSPWTTSPRTCGTWCAHAELHHLGPEASQPDRGRRAREPEQARDAALLRQVGRRAPRDAEPARHRAGEGRPPAGPTDR